VTCSIRDRSPASESAEFARLARRARRRFSKPGLVARAHTRTPPQLLTDTNPPDVICSAPRRRDVNPVYARQISIWKIRETYKCSCQSQPAPLTPLSIQHPGAAGGRGRQAGDGDGDVPADSARVLPSLPPRAHAYSEGGVGRKGAGGDFFPYRRKYAAGFVFVLMYRQVWMRLEQSACQPFARNLCPAFAIGCTSIESKRGRGRGLTALHRRKIQISLFPQDGDCRTADCRFLRLDDN